MTVGCGRRQWRLTGAHAQSGHQIQLYLSGFVEQTGVKCYVLPMSQIQNGCFLVMLDCFRTLNFISAKKYFWLSIKEIWYESVVWVIMGRQGYSQNDSAAEKPKSWVTQRSRGGLLTMFGVMGRLGPFDPPFSTYAEFWPLLSGVRRRILTPFSSIVEFWPLFFSHVEFWPPFSSIFRILTPIFINF